MNMYNRQDAELRWIRCQKRYAASYNKRVKYYKQLSTILVKWQTYIDLHYDEMLSALELCLQHAEEVEKIYQEIERSWKIWRKYSESEIEEKYAALPQTQLQKLENPHEEWEIISRRNRIPTFLRWW